MNGSDDAAGLATTRGEPAATLGKVVDTHEQPSDGAPAALSSEAERDTEPSPRGDPVAERDARRRVRAEQRGPRASGSPPSKRPRRMPFERLVASVVIVVIVVALAVIVGSFGPGAWALGLVCSVATLALVGVLPAATTRRSADRRYRGAPSRR